MFLEEPKPIKLYYEGNTDLFYSQPTRLILKLSKWLGSHQKILFVPLDKAELIWTVSNKLNQNILDTGLPIILDDRHQGPELFHHVRKLLANPQIRTILKQTKLTDISSYNNNLINSHHQDILARAFNQTKQLAHHSPIPLPTELLDKIVVSWNYAVWGDFLAETRYCHHNHPKLSDHYRIDIDQPREFDVNFLANTSFTSPPNPLLTLHRTVAYNQTEQLRGVPKIVQECNQHRFKWHDYFKILCQSKITISPWGWEPVTIRDVEAALAGSIIIKPDTTWLKTWPTIEYMICKPDYSDLSTIVNEVISNWDSYRDLRQKNKDTIILAIENIGYRMAEIIRS